MERHRVRMSRQGFDELRAHLFQGEREEVAFLFTRDSGDETSLVLQTEEIYRVPPQELDYQSKYHVSLTDDGLASIIKRAWDLEAIPVEAHSHRSEEFEAGFSASDFVGFEETVPHVRWRLQGAPYVALVFSPGGFDGLVWRGENDDAEPVCQLVVEDEVHEATGISHRRLSDDGR